MCIKYPNSIKNCSQEESSTAKIILKNVGKYVFFSMVVFVILSVTTYLLG